MVGIDEILDDGSGLVNSLRELVEVEMVRLGQVLELPLSLSFDNEGRAAAEASVVDSGDIGVMVRKFGGDFRGCDESRGEFGLFGYVGFSVPVGSVVMVVVRGGGHGEFGFGGLGFERGDDEAEAVAEDEHEMRKRRESECGGV